MAKQGMKRPEISRRKNDLPPVPEIQGKARPGHRKAPALVFGGQGMVWHGAPQTADDLATENMMNDFDMTAADQQDLGRNQ